jgi:retinoblastoma-like protein 1
MQNRNMFFVCLNSVKQTEKDVDLIVSLCHNNYHASEERLKEMMDKSHKAIEDVSASKH